MTKKNSRTKAPAFQFYSTDWLGSQTVKTLTFEEKGFYIDVLCLMHQNEKIGYLSKRSEANIHKLIGCSSRLIPRLSATLVELKLLLKDETTGELYNPRMVQDAALSQIRREAGKKGGNPNLLNQNDKQNTTPSSSSSSSSSIIKKNNKKKENKLTPKKEAEEFFKNLEYQQEVSKMISEEKGISIDESFEVIRKFVSYWTEPNSSGEKMRWQLEKTFEIKRRLTTWFSNNEKYKRNAVTKSEKIDNIYKDVKF